MYFSFISAIFFIFYPIISIKPSALMIPYVYIQFVIKYMKKNVNKVDNMC